MSTLLGACSEASGAEDYERIAHKLFDLVQEVALRDWLRLVGE